MDTAKKMQYSSLCLVCFYLVNLITVDSARMIIQPPSVTVGEQPGTSTSTPADVIMTCQPTANGIEAVYDMYIKRKMKNNDLYETFAEVHINGNPQMSNGAPQDVRDRSPRISGSIVTSNPSSSQLEARFYAHQMTCNFEAVYQCSITYRTDTESRIDVATSNLTVSVLASLYTISAMRVVMPYPTPLVNSSLVDLDEDIELTCTGEIGSTPGPIMEWFRKTENNMNMFVRYNPANSMDIQQQSPIQLECSYRRTSTLRYKISDYDRLGTSFQCEASIPVSTGVSRGYSPEFQVRPGTSFQRTNDGKKDDKNVLLLTSSVLFVIIFLFHLP